MFFLNPILEGFGNTVHLKAMAITEKPLMIFLIFCHYIIYFREIKKIFLRLIAKPD